MRVLVVVPGLMAVCGIASAQSQEDQTGWSEEGSAAEGPDGGDGILAAYTYLTGTSGADTIVYGDIIRLDLLVGPPCTGCEATNLGKGICVFYYGSGGTNYRGSFNYRSFWNPVWGSPMGIKGDTAGGTSADYIYASDEFGEGSVPCGAGYWVDTYGTYSCECGSAQADFDGVMEIHGDDGSSSSGGNDHVYGWDNPDTLYGNGGVDYVRAGGGADTIYGQDGNDDELRAESCTSGTETLYGGAGNDNLYGSDTTSCSDMMLGDSGVDYLRGYAGNDTLKGGYGDDTLDGWTGNDTLYGNQDNDNILGYTGDDTLCGGTGTDTCNGEAGTDACDTGASGCDERISCETIP